MVAVLRSVQHAALLERLAASGAAEAGQALIVSVETIKDRAAERWTHRCVTVRDFAEREFQRIFDPSDLIAPLDDVHYLIVQPGTSSLVAQGRAISFLRDVLEFFLGATSASDIRIARVTRLTGDTVEQAPLTPDEIGEAVRRAARETEIEASPREPLTTAAPRQVRRHEVLFVPQPIWSIGKKAIVSYRLRPTVFLRDGHDLLGPADLEVAATHEIIGVDLIALDEALDVMARAPPGARHGVHANLHLSTLNCSSGRQAVISRLSAASRETARRLVIELCGLGEGAPLGSLDAAVTMLDPFTLGVVGQAPSLATNVRAWRSTRLSAVSYDLSDTPPADAANLGESLARFVASAGAGGRRVIIHSVTTRAEALMAWAAGCTDLSGDVFVECGVDRFQPIRFDPLDLYPHARPRVEAPRAKSPAALGS